MRSRLIWIVESSWMHKIQIQIVWMEVHLCVYDTTIVRLDDIHAIISNDEQDQTNNKAFAWMLRMMLALTGQFLWMELKIYPINSTDAGHKYYRKHVRNKFENVSKFRRHLFGLVIVRSAMCVCACALFSSLIYVNEYTMRISIMLCHCAPQSNRLRCVFLFPLCSFYSLFFLFPYSVLLS